MSVTDLESQALRPYVPRLVRQWLRQSPDDALRTVQGSLAFVDVSGFTRLTERLATKGKVGAEEMNELLNAMFTQLLGVAYEDDAGLVKWGGDAVVLLFEGPEHAARACRSAFRMRRTMRSVGRLRTSVGLVQLRMSVGIHSGGFHFYLAGDRHRELVLTGPGASTTALMESTAEAGEIVISPATAELVDPRVVGAPKGDGWLLRAEPHIEFERTTDLTDVTGLDLARMVPEGIREHLLAKVAEPEHRSAVISFIAFGGVDRLVEEAGPEDLAGDFEELFQSVQSAVHRHGVTFFQTDIAVDGGKIMLLAGAPTSSENDEERMLLAVREIMDRSRRLSLQAGVNSGHVFAGDFGPPYRRTYTITGDAVNLAARLMAKARPGQVLVTEPVLARPRTIFQAEALEPFTVKGKVRPVHALALGAVAGARTTAEGILPLIGREREMSALQGALDAAKSRSGTMVELVGEPGIGKSRLVEELTRRASDEVVMSYACELYEASTPYAPFRVLFRNLLGIGPETDAAAVEVLLRRRVEANAPDLVPWLPLLGIPMDIRMADTPQTATLDEEFRRQRLQDVAAEFLDFALPTTTLLVFEDTHWMDEASAELLRRLASDLPHRPWMILVTRRDVATGFAPGGEPEVVSLRPEPLGTHEAVALLGSASDAAPLPPHQVAALAERAGGNPLFLQELLVAARTAGGLDELPESIEGVVTAQIDRLGPAERRLLRYASVLGTTFAQGVLDSLLRAGGVRADGETWDRLGAFVEREPGGTCRFRHVLIRDAAYQGLPFGLRRRLHAEAGRTIEGAARLAAEEQAEILSLHFFHARVDAKAWRYSRIAGERARAKYANVEAAEFYTRALEAGGRLPAVGPAEVAEVTEALGDVKERTGLFGEAATAYRSARRWRRGDPVAEAGLLLKEAWIPERLGRYSQALRLATRGCKLLEQVEGDEAARQRARLTGWRAAVLQAQGRHSEAIRWCTMAIAEAEGAGEKAALAHAYFILDWAYVASGRAAEARYSARALEIYRELGDLRGQAVVSNNMGGFAYYEGRWNDALELYEQGRQARERTGDPVNAAEGTANIGEIFSDQGRLPEAESLLREALAVWRAAGYERGIALAVSQLGRVAYRLGRQQDAERLLEEASTRFRDAGSQGGMLETDARIAECALFRRDWRFALSLADRTLGRARAAGTSVFDPMLHRIRGYASMQAGDLPAARDALAISLDLARAAHADHETAWTQEAIVRLHHLEGTRPPDLKSELAPIFERLGMIATPAIPLSP